MVAMFCSVATADSLKFKFLPGDKYSFVSVVEQNTSRVVDGNEKNSEQTTRLECDFDVEEVDDNGFVWAKYTYKRVTMKARLEDQKLDFDSDANQTKTPLLAMPLRMAVGEGLYLRITPQGRIGKINGLQGLITNAKAKMNSFSGAGLDMVSQNIGRRFAEPAVKRELENQLAVFPDSNGTGEIWSRKEVLSSADVSFAQVEQIDEVNIVFEKTFRLNPEKSGRDGIALVDVNLIIRPIVAPVANMQVSDQSVATSAMASREISGEGTGQIEIEKATGRIISNKMTQDMVERVKFTAPSQMLRPPPGPEPIISHTVTTFQMTKTADGKPAQSADANEKGAPSTSLRAG